MPAVPQRWALKLASLPGIIRRLSAVTIYVCPLLPVPVLCANLAQLHTLPGLRHLVLVLSEGYTLCPQAGALVGSLGRHLTSLSLHGGLLPPESAAALLEELACQPQSLDALSLLPDPRSGLGDDHMDAISRLSALTQLELRAYRLTSAGIGQLAALRRLRRLALHSLDSDTLDLDCLSTLSALRGLDLGMDTATALPSRALHALRIAAAAGSGDSSGGSGAADPATELSLAFKWTDRAVRLLPNYASCLGAALTRLDMGACRVTAPQLFDAVSALSRLRRLRMSLYSNADDTIECDLQGLSGLTDLRELALAKQHAYFPAQRRFLQSSLAVPVTAAAIAALAPAWRQLTSLRLALSVVDLRPDGLDALSAFDGLTELCLSVDYGDHYCHHAARGVGAAAAAGGGGGPGGSGLVALDLMQLPPGLRRLRLANLALELPALRFLADRRHLAALAALQLEQCAVRSCQLAALASKLRSSLGGLSLSHVSGLTDGGLAALACVTALTSLAVMAPHTDAVSQKGLLPLATLTGLRQLTWQSDDLTACGPLLDAFTCFTALRLLGLSCTDRTFEVATGASPDALAAAYLPYCRISCVRSSHYGGQQDDGPGAFGGGA